MADKLRVPPHSDEAEKSVLGAMFMDRDAVVEVIEFLHSDHFYSPKHQTIFQAMVDLYQEREPIDVVSVADRLKKAKAKEIDKDFLIAAD